MDCTYNFTRFIAYNAYVHGMVNIVLPLHTNTKQTHFHPINRIRFLCCIYSISLRAAHAHTFLYVNIVMLLTHMAVPSELRPS